MDNNLPALLELYRLTPVQVWRAIPPGLMSRSSTYMYCTANGKAPRLARIDMIMKALRVLTGDNISIADVFTPRS